MAKFTTKNIEFKDGQKAIFGTEDDAYLMWDDAGQQMVVSTVIDGVWPTSSGHLTPKWYVDSLITSSGTYHNALLGLDQDDHYQYVPTDGSRGFTSTVSGVDATEAYHLMTYQNMFDYLGGFDPTISGGVSASLTNFEYKVDLTSSQTTNTSYVNKLSLTVSGVPAGNYRLGWSLEWRQSKTNAEFWARVQRDGVEVYWEYEASPYVDVAFHYIVTNFYYMVLTSGTHTFNLDYRTSNSSTVSYIRSTKFEFWRIL